MRRWASAVTYVHNDAAVASSQLPTANHSTSNPLSRIPSPSASRTVTLIAKLPSPSHAPHLGPDGAPTSGSPFWPCSDGQAAPASPSPRLTAQLHSRSAAHSLLCDTSGRLVCGSSPFLSTALSASAASASGADLTLGVDLVSTAADGGTTGPRPPPQCLTAKPFQLDNTLLRHVVQQQGQQEQGQKQQGRQQGQGHQGSGVLEGCVVPDCAQWVQDVRRPSRDVCLLMADARRTHVGGRTPSFSHAHSPLHRYDGGGVSPLYALSPGLSRFASGPGEASPIGGGSGGGAKSLVMMGVAVGDSSTLALYLAFPSRLPPRLLAGVRGSCVRLLRTVGRGLAGGVLR